MWKKALWIYLGLYVIGVLGAIVYYDVSTVREGSFDLVTTLISLVFFLPAGLAALALRGRKVPLLLILLGLLIVAAPLVGIFKFNDFNLETVGKALLFVPMIAALLYFGTMRFIKKRPSAA